MGIEVTQEKLEAAIQRIVEAFDPQKVILFGSYAYGMPAPDSDVDLLVIMESNQRPARRAMAISRLFRPYPFPMDILVRTPKELEHRLQIGDLFLREITEKGEVLYERGIS